MTLLSSIEPIDRTPLDEYLAHQSTTPVERFAQRHAAELVPRQARYYRDLIPLSRPGPGQQYGFEVDLDACTGCKSCVAACHSLNGLDDGESWRQVTTMRAQTVAGPLQQAVTSACHHCADPACLKGCPVDAYEKHPITGVVVHLDDQCIGCRYCTLTCPYEVPVYNAARGIVRKCDLCHGRLAAGEAPACVQACPNGAIAITLVETAAVTHAATGGASLVAGAPPSAITVPTTTYRTRRPEFRELVDSAERPATPAETHAPLAVMLVLTQLSVGAFVTDLVTRAVAPPRAITALHGVDALVALATGLLALGASVLHLGRPRYCYRVIVGIRHSWLSREVVAFGAFMGLAAAYALILWLGGPWASPMVVTALGAVVAASGLAGVACSAMVYATTHRRSWRMTVVAPKFALSGAVSGTATVLWLVCVLRLSGGGAGPGPSVPSISRTLALLLGWLTAVKLAGEAAVFAHLLSTQAGEGARRARLLVRDLRRTTLGRGAAGLVGGVILPFMMSGVAITASPRASAAVATLSLALVIAGELAERRMFFAAATPPR